MKKSVYLETTVVGNIAGRLHPQLAMAYRQTVTRKWWETASERYDLFVSAFVIGECSDGDPTAAAERMAVIDQLPLLEVDAAAQELAARLLDHYAVPRSQPRDATHIAIAARHRNYLLVSWNFKHILNPETQRLIRQVCRTAGHAEVTLCTPEHLTESYDGTGPHSRD